MRCHPVILFLLTLFAGCQGGSIAGFWNTHSIDYSDIDAARDQFVAYAEKAVTAPEPEALSSLDVLFDKLHEDEVAGWMLLSTISSPLAATTPCMQKPWSG